MRWSVVAMVSLSTSITDAGATVRLSGRVLHASGQSSVYVALWQATGFLDKPAQSIRLAPGASTSFQFDVTPGPWAVSAFEDKNGNGVLDMGVFGPREPTGFWRPFTAWHKPKFDEVSSRVDRDTPNADITLR